jgi:hypothetical protein
LEYTEEKRFYCKNKENLQVIEKYLNKFKTINIFYLIKEYIEEKNFSKQVIKVLLENVLLKIYLTFILERISLTYIFL